MALHHFEFAFIEQDIRSGGYSAVGEVGIDLYWDKTFEREQMRALDRQLSVASGKGRVGFRKYAFARYRGQHVAQCRIFKRHYAVDAEIVVADTAYALHARRCRLRTARMCSVCLTVPSFVAL